MDLGVPDKLLKDLNIPTEELPNEEQLYQEVYEKVFSGEGKTEEAKRMAEKVAIAAVISYRCLIRNHDRATLN